MAERARQTGIHIMTDDEFQEYHRKLRKKKLLDDMLSASNSKSFSTKAARKDSSKAKEPARIIDGGDNIKQFQPTPVENKLTVTDDEWNTLLSHAFEEEQMTPIQKVTDAEMTSFTLDDVNWGDSADETGSYQKMYKKEQAMLSEILKDVTKQSEIANTVLKQLTAGGKLKFTQGSSISKLFPDLLSAANSLNSTRRAIVKDMSDLKKSAADFELKKAKELGAEGGDDVNSAANSFFSQIVGNRKEYMDAAMSAAMNNMPMTNQFGDSQDNYDDGFDDDSAPSNNRRSSFNLTAPLNGYDEEDEDDTRYDDIGYVDHRGYNDADPYGYLRNEGRDVSICVHVYGDGRLEFAAMDSNGEYVEDYELPGNDLLETMTIRPTSGYATDAEGRRYKVIRLNEHVDISDV